MSRIFAINVISNQAIFFIRIAVTFVMTPLYIRYMGLHDYGLWELAMALVGYAGMLDLGLWPTVSRFAAKYNGERDQIYQRKTFVTSLLFLSVVGLAAVLILAGVILFFNEDSPGASAHRNAVFFAILGVQVMLKFPGIVLEAYLEGLQLYWQKSVVSACTMLANTLVVYAIIADFDALILVAVTTTIASFVRYGVFVHLMKSAGLPMSKIRINEFDRKHLGTLLKFGFKSFVQGVSARVDNYSSTLIAGFMGGLALVPLYILPLRVLSYARDLVMASTHVFMPYFSDLHAANRGKEIAHVFLVGSRAVNAGVGLAWVGVLLLGPAFISAWVGSEFRETSEILIPTLCVGILLPYLNPLGSRVLTALDKHAVFAKVSPITSILNVLVGLILFQHFGLLGLAISLAAAATISTPIYVVATCRAQDILLRRFLFNCILPALLAAGLAFFLSSVFLVTHEIDASMSSIIIDAFKIALLYLIIFLLIDRLYPLKSRSSYLIRNLFLEKRGG